MKPRRSVLIQILAFALAIAMSFVIWPFLPQVVPIHWALNGRPDAWGSPALLLFIMPAVMGGILAGTFAMVKAGKSDEALMAGLAVIGVFFVAEHGIILGAALRAFFPIRPLLAVVFGLFVGLAPFMAKVHQNPWFGVRTPWTLGSRRVWRETHRATARLWLVGGIVGAALAIFAPLLISIAFLIFLSLYPVAISYFVWRRAGRP